MNKILIGEFIRQRRKDLGITQAQLCEGICDTVTLSRIENDKQTPNRITMNALLQRLGAPESRFFAVLSKDESKIEDLMIEIVSCNIHHDTVNGLKYIDELEALIDDNDNLSHQFILRSKMLLGTPDGPYSHEDQLDMLMGAIRMTVPRFDLNKINDFIYSIDEVKIINQIALEYGKIGDHKKAVDIFMQLLSYIQEHYQNILQSGGLLPLVTHNYAIELLECKRYDDAIEMAELGRQSCIKYGHYQHLPGLLATMAECYFFLGDNEKSLDYYKRAYYLYEAVENQRALDKLKNEVAEHFGTDVTF
jgi:transcriptional regulator with XRE-family HTH domain